MTTTIQPTRAAQRVHLSHLATSHRAPLVPAHRGATRAGARTRATSFTPMARAPLTDEASSPRSQSRALTTDH